MMTNNLKLRMEYNPYQQQISYHIYENESRQWQELAAENDLKKAKYQSTPLQNVVDEVIAVMIEKFSYNGQFDLVFSGTDEDFFTLEDSVQQNSAAQKFINLCKDEQSWYTSAAKVSEQIDKIFQELEDEFHQLQDKEISHILKQYEDAASTTIPICVTGLYSSGKSAFINALIGEEILPSDSDPLTAQIFRIVPSTDYRISFKCGDKNLKFEIANKQVMLLNQEDCSQCGNLIRKITAIAGISNAQVMYHIIALLNGDITNSDVIHVEVPFHNSSIPLDKINIEIYDTPGSDAASHKDHREILENALSQRTNGLPVLITTREDLDREGITHLMEELDENAQLDRNNILVVLNKADSDVNKKLENFKNSHGSTKTAITSWQNTKTFLLSSAMAIGCKKSIDTWNDQNCKKAYRNWEDFVSCDDEGYMNLPKYNLLPYSRYRVILGAAQKVQKQVISGDTSDATRNELIAQNSGIRGIENEITYYAQRYANYNKCRTAADYLDKAIQKTREHAEKQKLHLEQIKQKQETQFNETYHALNVKLSNFTQDFCGKARKSDLIPSDAQRNKLTGEAHKAIDNAYEKHKKDKSTNAFSTKINQILRGALTDFKEYVKKLLLSFWKSKEREYKEHLVQQINGETNISETEKEFLSSYIWETQTFEPSTPVFFNVVQDGYVKEKKLLWFKLGLNFKSKDCKLAFDQKLKSECYDTMNQIRKTFGDSFDCWSKHLLEGVQGKLGEFNPTLNQLAKEIEESKFSLHQIELELERLQSAQVEIGKLMVKQYKEETV